MHDSKWDFGDQSYSLVSCPGNAPSIVYAKIIWTWVELRRYTLVHACYPNFSDYLMYSLPGYMGASLTQLSHIMTQETTNHHTVNIYP